MDLTVARPGPRRASDPVTAIHDRVDHLRRMAWWLARAGTAPSPILANTAAIGVAIARAAAREHRRAATHHGIADSQVAEHVDAAESADIAAERWAEVARQVADLRSAHPSATTIQVERVDIARLLDQAARTAPQPGEPPVADGLTAALRRYAEVAEHLSAATRAAHERGEVYLRGRALPTHFLGGNDDLIEAKLADRPVPVPTVLMHRLEGAYAGLQPAGSRRPSLRRGSSDAGGSTSSPTGGPPPAA